MILCDNTDDDRDNPKVWAFVDKYNDGYLFLVRETDPDPNLPATTSDDSWMEPEERRYYWGPYVSIAPTFEAELMKRVYKRE